MTEGGNTSGSVTRAPTGSRQREGVRASHQASGVPSTSSSAVVTAARRSVSAMAGQVSGLRARSVMRAWRGSELVAVRQDGLPRSGVAQVVYEGLGRCIVLAGFEQHRVLADGVVPVAGHAPGRAGGDP